MPRLTLPVLLLAATLATPAAADCDRDCRVAAAQAYLDALVSHDASQVPLADNAQRVEQGRVTGTSGEDIRQGLEHDYRFRIITSVRDAQFIAEGDEVAVLYTVDALGYGSQGREAASSRTFERFRVVGGLITEIEVVLKVIPGHYTAPTWPDR